jgi:hypothetical protein
MPSFSSLSPVDLTLRKQQGRLIWMIGSLMIRRKTELNDEMLRMSDQVLYLDHDVV